MVFIIQTSDEVAGIDIMEALINAGISNTILSKQDKDPATLRKAGERMAERLRHINEMKWLSEQTNEFNSAALAEWEAANK